MAIELGQYSLLRNDANLQGYWKFESDGTDAKAANTLSGVNTPTFTTGQFNNCTDLEASSSHYFQNTTPSAALQITGDMTINMWINQESDPPSNDNMQLVSLSYATNTRRTYLFQIRNNAGTMELRFFHRNSSDLTDNVGVTWSHSLSTWYMITMTITGTTVKFFVNGVQQGTDQTLTQSRTYDANADFFVGTIDSSAVQFFDGKIDDLSIFNREVTATELLNYYNTVSSSFFMMF